MKEETVQEHYDYLELLLDELYERFTQLYNYGFRDHLRYHQLNKHQKSISRVFSFIRKIRMDLRDHYREKVRSYYISEEEKQLTQAERQKESKQLKREMKNLMKLLEEIEKRTRGLLQASYKTLQLEETEQVVEEHLQDFFAKEEKELQQLEADTERFLKRDQAFLRHIEKDRDYVLKLIDGIFEEARRHEKKNEWLTLSNEKGASYTHFACQYPVHKLRYLELLPLFNISDIRHRHLHINEMHKDRLLPVYHYNLEDQDKKRNIHVIPSRFKKEIEPYIQKAA